MEWQEDPSEEEIQAIKKKIEAAGYDPSLWFVEEKKKSSAYLPYTESDSIIWIWTRHDELKPLSACSEIVKALLRMENTLEKRIYYVKL